MKFIASVLLLLCATVAAAQSPRTFAWSSPSDGDVQIRIGGFVTAATGAEKNDGIWHSILPTIGKPFAARWSMWDCGYFQLSVANDDKFAEGSTTGWKIEITPTRVVDRAITFRLRWVRALDSGKEFTPPGEDVELTLRPGEERPIDRVMVPPGAKTLDGKPCRTTAASLRLSVENYPQEDFDRRLITADLWLVERLPNGNERSQPLSVRGLPNRVVPFYFDSIADGSVSLEIFGHLVARPVSGGLELALQVRSRWGESTFDWRKRGEWSPQWLESTIHAKPQEIVQVPLPKLGKEGGPFADRVFSIRIRARQVR